MRALFAACLWLAGLAPAAGAEATEVPAPTGTSRVVWRSEDGLPQNTVRAITQDAKGYLWFGTHEGLARFDGKRFTVFDRASQEAAALQSNLVNALQETPDGSLWVGTQGGLHRLRQGQMEVFTTDDGLPSESIEDILLTPGDELWIATRQGLVRYVDGRFQAFGTALSHPYTSALAAAEDGTLWVGTQAGLNAVSGDEVLPIAGLERLQNLYVLALQFDDRGRLWIGTVAGLFVFDGGKVKEEPTLPNLFVFTVLPAAPEGTWIGTQRGLFFLDEQGIHHHSTRGGLTSETIFDLFEDRDGSLWIGTFKGGLHRIPRHRISPSPAPEAPTPLPVHLEKLRLAERKFEPAARIELPAGAADLEFHFTAIDFDQPERITFQAILENYDDEWLDLGRERRYATYTNIPPGSYRFRVRAETPDGRTGQAETRLYIPPHFYQTLWFRGLCLALGLALATFLYRRWVRRLLDRRAMLEKAVQQRTAELLEQKDRLAQTHHLLERTYQRSKKANRELKALYREKSDFLAIAAHDLRAPLVNLKGFAHELRTALEIVTESLNSGIGQLEGEAREAAVQTLQHEVPEALEFLESSAYRMEQLIRPILKLSRLSRRRLEMTPLALEEELETVQRSLAERLQETGSSLVYSSLPIIVADPESIREILSELLRNAINFLDPARPCRIEVFSESTDRETIVHVRDNGRGITESERERVFRIFGYSGRQSAPGRGMGLVYVRTLIHRHGGRIWYQSQPGRGTTFSFSLPTQQQLQEQGSVLR